MAARGGGGGAAAAAAGEADAAVPTAVSAATPLEACPGPCALAWGAATGEVGTAPGRLGDGAAAASGEVSSSGGGSGPAGRLRREDDADACRDGGREGCCCCCGGATTAAPAALDWLGRRDSGGVVAANGDGLPGPARLAGSRVAAAAAAAPAGACRSYRVNRCNGPEHAQNYVRCNGREHAQLFKRVLPARFQHQSIPRQNP